MMGFIVALLIVAVIVEAFVIKGLGDVCFGNAKKAFEFDCRLEQRIVKLERAQDRGD